MCLTASFCFDLRCSLSQLYTHVVRYIRTPHKRSSPAGRQCPQVGGPGTDSREHHFTCLVVCAVLGLLCQKETFPLGWTWQGEPWQDLLGETCQLLEGSALYWNPDYRVEGIFRQREPYLRTQPHGNTIAWSETYKHINIVGVVGLNDESGNEPRKKRLEK